MRAPGTSESPVRNVGWVESSRPTIGSNVVGLEDSTHPTMVSHESVVVRSKASLRSTPLSASRNYYPGFWAAFFLVLLRMAIGWHFHTEGWEKIKSYRVGDKPFSAEVYLRNATGPLAPYFRGLVPDVNSLAKLDPDRLKPSWRDDVDRIGAHYGFNEEQQGKAKAELAKAEQFADKWFLDPENVEKRDKYLHDLYGVQMIERDFGALSFEKERAWAKRKDLEADRKTLTKEIDDQATALRDAVSNIATSPQKTSAGPFKPAWTQLDVMNMVVTYGVWLIGLCLILGLMTRLSALGAAFFLLNIYFCIPPWPGLPESPKWEGHYFIVDKNMVEAIACLALAFLPTGHWVGLDSVFFGHRRRRVSTER